MTLALFSVGKTARIVRGDSAEVLRAFADNSVDSIVTDPPSAIGFMGMDWDDDKSGRDPWVTWLSEILREARRVLKPGGHALVWALPRTSHWTGLAVELAGFEIRDRVTHLFGEGMPKSPHVLKPAAEDWWLARKPFKGTARDQIAKHGIGGLNIDVCRLEGEPEPFHNGTARSGGILGESSPRGRWEPTPGQGRWPAHVTLDTVAAAQLDEQAGVRRSGGAREGKQRGPNAIYGKASDSAFTHDIEPSTGGASRFFYVAKADEADKTEGGAVENDHETVKSTTLMRWLVRLVTPPGGIVLDPFAGSGTTGVACAAEGLSFIGIEQNAKHHETARRRLERWYGAVGVAP